MSRQVILSIYIVGLNRSCDFSVPADMGIRTAVSLIQKILIEEYGGSFLASQEKLNLINAKTGKILNDAFSFCQLGMDESEKLILA